MVNVTKSKCCTQYLGYKLIKTTEAQKLLLNKSLSHEIQKGDEKSLTYLILQCINQNNLVTEFVNLLTKEKVATPIDLWFEAEPLSIKKGKSGKSEGNSKIDLAFGAIKPRGNTGCGIEYNSKSNDFVCFVEAKYLSDCSLKTKHDILRNQLTRIIENLLCFQGDGMLPERLHFVLITPQLFKDNYWNRLYGHLFMKYQKNKLTILEHIQKSEISNRNSANWSYPESLENRINQLSLHWVSYEEIFKKILNIEIEDVTKITIPNLMELIKLESFF